MLTVCQEDFDSTDYNSPYDSSFVTYLQEIRRTCINKDTLELHELLGDSCFGWSCYGAELPTRDFNSDWLIFKNHFSLIKEPDSSKFWNFFLTLSEDGVYFDSLWNVYRIPSYNSWGGLLGNDKKNTFKIGWHDPIPIEKMITIYASPDYSNYISSIDFPKDSKSFSSDYRYHFKYFNHEFYEIYDGTKMLGYVPFDKLMWWNFHFEFKKHQTTKKWYLCFYEVCYY